MSAIVGALLVLLGIGCEVGAGAHGEAANVRQASPPKWAQFLPLIGLMLIVSGLLLLIEWWINA